ncbi:glycosyltransferase [Iningainema tapete]|uniref:Glycosyltransferase n=1 Tax=Iningainema tapete BLCC-T55 TaxID=2748662 RepID=A0A8J6XJ25_9CYAN|nr:glycosyltransferase [Iningainema tapete]MBD2772384.1 glycosyltransferase [Iningainema tapete BLCC-T55]
MVSSAKHLRVLHICQRDDLATGGAARVAVEYVKRLPNYEVDARCLFLYGSPGYFQSELGVSAHYLGIKNSQDFGKFGRLTKFIKQFQPDIIHHHDGLLWSHLLTFFHPGIFKVTHAHLGANSNSFSPRNIVAAWLQRQSTNLLICITEDTRNSQIEQGGYKQNRTYVLYNGVERSRFKPPTPTQIAFARKNFQLTEHARVVGFVGRLHCEMKGTDDFLRMIALLPSNYVGLVVGSGPDADQLKQLAQTLKISQRVVFTGIIENTAVAYHAMNVFCLTSHWEPFGLVVAEAMACGLPIVSLSCTGGVNELLTKETGFLLPDRDLEKMAQAAIEAVEHPEVGRERSINSRLRLQQYHDWDNNTSKLANLYKNLLPLTSNLAK